MHQGERDYTNPVPIFIYLNLLNLLLALDCLKQNCPASCYRNVEGKAAVVLFPGVFCEVRFFLPGAAFLRSRGSVPPSRRIFEAFFAKKAADCRQSGLLTGGIFDATTGMAATPWPEEFPATGAFPSGFRLRRNISTKCRALSGGPGTRRQGTSGVVCFGTVRGILREEASTSRRLRRQARRRNT